VLLLEDIMSPDPLRNINPKKFYSLKNNRDRIKFLLQYAILAPSTHNSQPWLFKIHDSYCEIFKDESKYLIEADSKGRNLYISLGCCVENIIVAAKYFEVFKEIIIEPITHLKNKTLVVTIRFKNLSKVNNKNVIYQELFDAISRRATNRGLFKNIKIPASIIYNINKIKHSKDLNNHIIVDKKNIIDIAEITKNAIGELYSKKRFREELSSWIYPDYKNRKEGISTKSLRIPFFLSIFFSQILKLFNISNSISYLNYKSIASLSSICIISSSKDSETIWLEVGRFAQRILLHTTTVNIDTYISVAAIDVNFYANKIKKILHTDKTPHFLIGLGYGYFPKVFSNRHSLETKILNQKI